MQIGNKTSSDNYRKLSFRIYFGISYC